MKTPSLVSTAALVGVSALLLAGCSAGGSGGETRRRRGGHARLRDPPRRGVVAALGELRPPVPRRGPRRRRLRGRHPERPGRRQQVLDDRRPAAHPGLRRHAARRLQGRGRCGRREGQGRGHPGHRVRPSVRGRRLLRVVRQRRGRTPGGPDGPRRPRDRRQGPGDRGRRLHGRRPDRRQRRDVPRWRRRGHGGRGHHAGRRAPGSLGQARSRRPTSSRRSPRSVARSTACGSRTTPTPPASSRSCRTTTSLFPSRVRTRPSRACRTCCSAGRRPRSTSPSRSRPTPRSNSRSRCSRARRPRADQELEDGTPYIAVTPQLVGPTESSTSSPPATPTGRALPGRGRGQVRGVRHRVDRTIAIEAPDLGGTTAGVGASIPPPSVGRRVPH